MTMSMLLYNPDRKNRQQLIDEFVVRTRIFNELFADLLDSKMTYPEQHYLLVGQRGSGKTTLLTRLRYAIEDEPGLKRWLIPVAFSEEQYNISELANLWESIAAYLEDYHGFEGLTEAIEAHSSKTDFESIAFDLLIKVLERKGKKLVLFIDNIGDMLARFDELEVRRLREILQTKPHIRLIAGSSVLIESTLDYHQPLFEFFKVIQLKGLTNEETITLLRKMAAVHHQTEKIERIIQETPARIEILRRLSGGIPRTIALLFEVFMDNEHGSALTDLEQVLDAVTPLYKHRMDDLPAQQQKIVHAVAIHWDPISVKDLKERVRLESKVISAQLRQLEKNQVIEKIPTDTKNHLYQIRERFFNIWYLMRYGRKQDRRRVIWLVKFLEMWCDPKELEERIRNYADGAKTGKMDQKALELYGEVYSMIKEISAETKMILRESTPEYIARQVILSDEEFDKEIARLSNNKDWEKFLKTVINKVKLDVAQKEQVFQLLSDPDAQVKVPVLMKKLRDDMYGLNGGAFPYMYAGFAFHFLQPRRFVSLSSGTEEGNQEYIKYFVELYLGMVEDGYEDIYELNHALIPFIVSLLMAKRYHVAISILQKNFAIGLEDKYQIPYLLAQYFAAGEREEVLSTAAPEKRELVLNLIPIITQFHKESRH